MEKTLGGDRLGSGKKMKVHLHGYERSTHDIGYIWRSTMAAGTLVPFLTELALPGDTFDINLDIDVKTHPTIGPLFGSYKVQADIFQLPIRLYQGQLHNNKLGIGMNMANVKLPQMRLRATIVDPASEDIDNSQINPSCILSYLNIRGVGMINAANADTTRLFNAIPYIGYWDIYKNYYANKQEEIGAVIHTTPVATVTTIDSITVDGTLLPVAPALASIYVGDGTEIVVAYTGARPILEQEIINFGSTPIPLNVVGTIISESAGVITMVYNWGNLGNRTMTNWNYITSDQLPVGAPNVDTFNLSDIDDMREAILTYADGGAAVFVVNDQGIDLYDKLLTFPLGGQSPYKGTQEGLGIKTYQSDLFNNWLSTEWIDGAGGITEVTSIDTSGGSFSIDTLNLSKKVYDMLNRIAVSGGTYNDWIDAVFTHDRFITAESPIYHGGLIKELVFQEVVSNAQSEGGEGTQPLGTLAGKGVMAKKHKGGQVTIKVDEPSYIMGIISLTPRIDYSQGNKWDVNLKTMDDLHKPALDEIGFQELITEQMAWWSTTITGGIPVLKSAGKQPAWINYMTNVNQTRGNFAIPSNEMFMTLNRRYETNGVEGPSIEDLTTYIDPVKFNHIFAQTSIDAQNFWTQIAVDITARRKLSAKIMPNL